MGDRAPRRTRIFARTSALLTLAIGLAACGSATGGAASTLSPTPESTAPAATRTPMPPAQTAAASPVAASPAAAAEPLADEILGTWYETAPGFWWFFRAGDPVCVKVVRTNLDCLAYQLVGQPAAVGAA